jgi:sec-independent protein translocase protein TatB
MLNIGFGEILLIGALLLVVVGPERLPDLLRKAGRQYAKLRRAANELQHAFMDEGDMMEAAQRRAESVRRTPPPARHPNRAADSADTAGPAPDSAGRPADPAPPAELPGPEPVERTGGRPGPKGSPVDDPQGGR